MKFQIISQFETNIRFLEISIQFKNLVNHGKNFLKIFGYLSKIMKSLLISVFKKILERFFHEFMDHHRNISPEFYVLIIP